MFDPPTAPESFSQPKTLRVNAPKASDSNQQEIVPAQNYPQILRYIYVLHLEFLTICKETASIIKNRILWAERSAVATTCYNTAIFAK
jgi:hypothetical protein